LQRLPLTSLEGFLLTQLDGRFTLSDLAEVHGMTLAEIFPLADRLVELGAASIVKKAAAKSTKPPPAMRSRRPTPAPVPTRSRRPSAAMRIARARSTPPTRSPTPPPVRPPAVEPRRARITLERPRAQRPAAEAPNERRSPEDYALFRMYRSAKQGEARRHVALFLEAAEEAVRRDDPVAAARNLRLALQNHDDPVVRAKLAAVEDAANERLHARHVARARVAERREQWTEAAECYEQAHALRAEAWSAERAANALLRSGGDLRRAVQLADLAVLAEPDVAAYRLTLGEVCLAAKLSKRAAAEAERALALDPSNARALALSVATRK
jgi:hypothetical protein